jgi:electron-transferring-flavoprotein dehydrogenase
MLHPYLWRYLKGGKLRSWGAKTLGESGRRGEPHLAGDGYARIGEGSGSTNVLTGSGVDEAWATGTQLAEAVIELLKAKKPFTKENLEETYVKRRRASWVESEGRVAEKSRDGFQKGVVTGMIGMALAGLTNGEIVARQHAGPAVETHSDGGAIISPDFARGHRENPSRVQRPRTRRCTAR